MSATRWKDTSTSPHVEYDLRPDVFRYVIVNFPIFTLSIKGVDYAYLASILDFRFDL